MKTFLILLILTVVFAVSAVAQTDWSGSYVFEENGGRTAGGTGIVVTHQIDISASDDGYVALISSNGFQTSKDLVCTGKVAGTKLLIYFDSYGENNVLEPFKQGDLLLTLERKNVKNKPEVLTTWGKFLPIVEANEKPGKVYFREIVVKKDLL